MIFSLLVRRRRPVGGVGSGRCSGGGTKETHGSADRIRAGRRRAVMLEAVGRLKMEATGRDGSAYRARRAAWGGRSRLGLRRRLPVAARASPSSPKFAADATPRELAPTFSDAHRRSHATRRCAGSAPPSFRRRICVGAAAGREYPARRATRARPQSHARATGQVRDGVREPRCASAASSPGDGSGQSSSLEARGAVPAPSAAATGRQREGVAAPRRSTGSVAASALRLGEGRSASPTSDTKAGARQEGARRRGAVRGGVRARLTRRGAIRRVWRIHRRRVVKAAHAAARATCRTETGLPLLTSATTRCSCVVSGKWPDVSARGRGRAEHERARPAHMRTHANARCARVGVGARAGPSAARRVLAPSPRGGPGADAARRRTGASSRLDRDPATRSTPADAPTPRRRPPRGLGPSAR